MRRKDTRTYVPFWTSAGRRVVILLGTGLGGYIPFGVAKRGESQWKDTIVFLAS